MRYFKLSFVFAGLFAVLGLSLGCNNYQKPENSGAKITKAICVLHPTTGHGATGTVTFTQVEGGIRVIAEIDSLAPGKHGFHIHQYGDCSSGDGKSAGGHFNPAGVAHGSPDSTVHHVGDLGNIVADSTGHGALDRVYSFLSFSGENSIIGRGVIVHRKADDLTSQPTGAAGARVACGVIGIAKP